MRFFLVFAGALRFTLLMSETTTPAAIAHACIAGLRGLSSREKLHGFEVHGLQVSALVDMQDRAVICVQGEGDADLETCTRLAAYWNRACAGSAALEVETPEDDPDIDEVESLVRLNLDHVAKTFGSNAASRSSITELAH